MPTTERKELLLRAVVIGVSAGGIEALTRILPLLPDDFAAPILVVQHMGPDSDSFLAKHFDSLCRVRVKEAEDLEEVVDGVVYIAPPDYHLMIEDDETIVLSVDEKVNYARPSIDVLFESAADVYGSEFVGIVLTGANNDGSQGVKTIKERGGLVIVQDPASAYMKAMPESAILATDIDYVLPLEDIGSLLLQLFDEKNDLKNTG